MPGYELINRKEKEAVAKLFDEGGVLFAHGFDNLRKHFHVREFESKCSNYFKSKYTLFVSSGTAALKIALKALGVKQGDEVITQSFNFIATVEAILDIGAIPKIVNVDLSLNMDPYDLEKKISKKTKAVIPVHMLGFSCDLDKINTICKKFNIHPSYIYTLERQGRLEQIIKTNNSKVFYTSKYKRVFGYTLQELSEKYNTNISNILCIIRKNNFKKFSDLERKMLTNN